MQIPGFDGAEPFSVRAEERTFGGGGLQGSMGWMVSARENCSLSQRPGQIG